MEKPTYIYLTYESFLRQYTISFDVYNKKVVQISEADAFEFKQISSYTIVGNFSLPKDVTMITKGDFIAAMRRVKNDLMQQIVNQV